LVKLLITHIVYQVIYQTNYGHCVSNQLSKIKVFFRALVIRQFRLLRLVTDAVASNNLKISV